MSKRKKPRKVFALGQAVEVQREVGKPWEPATYVRAFTDWKGWHRVSLPADSAVRYVNTMTGMESTKDDPRAIASRVLSVPTQRVRAKVEARS